MLSISRAFLNKLAKALREEPSLRPETELLAEQLTIKCLQMDQEDQKDKKDSGEWR